MSCLSKIMLLQIATVSGLPVERLRQMMDVARRMSLPRIPLDLAVVEAMQAGLPPSHDSQQSETLLQLMAQGLRLALRQSQERPPDARELALLTALTGQVMPDLPPPVPALVQVMRANLCLHSNLDLRPAPLPRTLPDDPDARRRAVLAAACVGAWTDEEADRIVPYPALVGLAWALGVRHPRIRAVVEESIEAAAAALSAGATDPDLLRRVVMEKSPRWAVAVLVTSNRSDPDLIAKAAEHPLAATAVLVERRDLADPILIARSAEWTETAAEVLITRRDITDPALVTAAAEWPRTAVKVLKKRRDITDPALIAAAAQDPSTAAEVLVVRTDLTSPPLIRAAARTADTAAEVLSVRADLASPPLIRAAARTADTAARVLVVRADLASPPLIRAAARTADTAARVLFHRHDLSDPALIARAAEYADTAADVLSQRRDLADPVLIAAAVRKPDMAVEVLSQRRDLRSQRDVIDHVCNDRDVAYAVVGALGPYPALWQALPAPLRDEIASYYQMTPRERAWIDGLATRIPPAWTEADDAMAARFPWHAALRDSLRTESSS